jgi:hypothetical protein
VILRALTVTFLLARPPSSLLIDRAGDIVAVAIGPRDWDSLRAHAVLEALLK